MFSFCGCGLTDNDSLSTSGTIPIETTEMQSSNAETDTLEDNTDFSIDPVLYESKEFSDTEKIENSVAMLNYIMIVTEKIKQSESSKLVLEEIGNSMLNDFFPNAIDKRTQEQITNLYNDVSSLRMISVKRERLSYIYNQNKAQSITKAIPSPMSILNIVQSGSKLKTIASAAYLAVDAIASYENASNQIEMEYLQDGWKLDDKMEATLDSLKLAAFNYLQDIVNEYEVNGDLTLSQEMAGLLIKWENNDNLERRIEFLKNHREYKNCGYYWLLLSRSCFEVGDYKGCVEAMETYIKKQPRLFRRDTELAKVLPMAISCLNEKYSGNELVQKESEYADILSANVAVNDWASRYYAAITYMDLYVKTNNNEYLIKAFNEAKTNVNEVMTASETNWINAQMINNEKYSRDVEDREASKTATEDEKKQIKEYNKMLKELRKTELPPIDDSLLINVKLMLDLANKLNLPDDELKSLDKLIHSNNENLFLVDTIDSNLWASKKSTVAEPDITFDRGEITIPANYVCSKSVISVKINGKEVGKSEDWVVESVKRKGGNLADYIVTFKNDAVKDATYQDGDIVVVSILPYNDYFEATTVSFKTIVKKYIFVNTYNFEKIS